MQIVEINREITISIGELCPDVLTGSEVKLVVCIIKHPDHQSKLITQCKIGFDTGMGEGAVREHIRHAVIDVIGRGDQFIAKKSTKVASCQVTPIP